MSLFVDFWPFLMRLLNAGTLFYHWRDLRHWISHIYWSGETSVEQKSGRTHFIKHVWGGGEKKDQRIILCGFFFFLTSISRMPISLAILHNTLPIILEEVKDSRRDKSHHAILKMHRKRTGRNCANIQIFIYAYAVRLWVMVCLHLNIFSEPFSNFSMS